MVTIDQGHLGGWCGKILINEHQVKQEQEALGLWHSVATADNNCALNILKAR